jgi:ABC-2 type transport system permease protein/lipopolysaccharide transport system permease protein
LKLESADSFYRDPVAERRARRSRTVAAWDDLIEGLAQFRLWSSLALRDIKLRYKGSVLGPFWVTLSYAAMIAGIGFIYAELFRRDPATYLPYLMCGLVIWFFVAGMINDACQTFLGAKGIIDQIPMPLSVHAYRTVWRSLIILAHNLVIIPFGFMLYPPSLNWTVITIVPAIMLLAINGIWVCLLLGLLCARFRDIGPIVSNFVTVAFFVTPIMWHADSLSRAQTVLQLNPLFAAIDVVRAPLLGEPMAPYSWAVLVVGAIVGWVVAFAMFARFRGRIAYWI